MLKYLILLPALMCTITIPHSIAQNTHLDSLANSYMEEIINHKGKRAIHNVQMSYIHSGNYEFHGAAGLEKKNGVLISNSHQFKIASVTKTFTATIILERFVFQTLYQNFLMLSF